MGRDTNKDQSEASEELEPALPKAVKTDQVSAVIGEVGRWQLEKILIVFLAAAPGRGQTREQIGSLSLVQVRDPPIRDISLCLYGISAPKIEATLMP